MDLFHGLSAFSLTPTDADGIVQTQALSALIDHIKTADVQSIGLLGSTGGYAYLTREERQRTIHAAVECLNGTIPLIVGVSALRTDEAQALARDAQALGASGLLLSPMSYTPLTDEEVFQHFMAVAQATDLPLCIYNNPGTTKFTFDVTLIQRLANVANIVAIKMPLPADGDFTDEIARLRAVTPSGFAIGYSGDWGAADALLAGCDAWYSVIAGLLPVPALKLTQAAATQNLEKAREIDQSFAPLWSLFEEFGSFRVMYVIADLLGLCSIEPPRPILPLTEPARDRVRQALLHIEVLQ